jgi:hypothetical protein
MNTAVTQNIAPQNDSWLINYDAMEGNSHDVTEEGEENIKLS